MDWTDFPVEKVYKNKQQEKIKVLRPCLDLCKKLRIAGYILQHRRLSELDSCHILGDPDIEIWIDVNEYVHILMCECKKPDGGVLSRDQVSRRERYKAFKNVTYAVVRSKEELHRIIKEIRSKIIHKPLDIQFNA